jgi:hypothetical protein
MTETDFKSVKGIQKDIDYEFELMFLLDFVVDFASKRSCDGSAILDCKSQQKVHCWFPIIIEGIDLFRQIFSTC